TARRPGASGSSRCPPARRRRPSPSRRRTPPRCCPSRTAGRRRSGARPPRASRAAAASRGVASRRPRPRASRASSTRGTATRRRRARPRPPAGPPPGGRRPGAPSREAADDRDLAIAEREDRRRGVRSRAGGVDGHGRPSGATPAVAPGQVTAARRRAMLACPTMANADVARIRAYHDGTKHSFASIRASGHRLEWDIMPRPFKVYPELDAMPLPRELTTAPRPALVALADPGTTADARVPLDVAALAHLLYFSAGIVRRKKYPGGEIYFRAAACTGALYHIEVYLVCGPLAGLDAGVYHFGAHDFSLRRLRAGDHRGALVAATGGEPSVAEAPATLVCTTTYWRNAWKYQARAYRHAFWDGGTLLANLLGLAAGVGLPARIVAGFVDADVNSLLDVDPAREAAIALVPVGGAASAPPPPPEAPALALATLPVSAREIDYPAIRDAHAASSLATPEEARAWRGAAAATAGPAPADAVPLAPPVEVAEPLESVILRRGSTRHFARAPIAFDAFSTLLR